MKELRVAGMDEREHVKRLLEGYLESEQARGSDVLPTQRTLAFFMGIFHQILSGELQGFTLLHGQVGIHMVAEAPLGYDTLHGRTALGWVTYVAPGARRQKIGTGMREAGFELLRRMGFESAIGAVDLNNKAGIESAERTGFAPYQLLLVKNLKEG